MELFELGRLLHSAAGTVALGAFWTAALATKGGPLHKKAGKIYLLGLIAVMALSTLMVAGKLLHGDPAIAIFLLFLISMVGTASWLMWFSVRYRRAPERLVGHVYRGLASWLVLAGGALFWLGVSRRAPLTMFLSLLGAGFGANMWRLALSANRDGRWWLAHHLNGVMLNFIATHDSFLALGIGSVVPELRQPVPRMLIAVGITVVGVVLRVRFRGAGRPTATGEMGVRTRQPGLGIPELIDRDAHAIHQRQVQAAGFALLVGLAEIVEASGPVRSCRSRDR